MIYLSEGSLSYQVDGTFRRYDSQFIREKIAWIEQNNAATAWRRKPGDAGADGLVSRSMLWGNRGGPIAAPEIVLAEESERGFYFVVQLSRAAGLFHYDIAKDEETRLFHREEFLPVGLAVTADHLITTTRNDDGSVHLCSYNREGRDPQTLTAGDTQDGNPFPWKERIFYDSRGIGRLQDGAIGAFGPSGIYAIATDGSHHEVIRESATYDYLMPKVGADGTIYAIRRPYDHGRPSPWQLAKDLALFPFRVVLAIVSFLDAFSRFFANKPLLTAGGAPVQRDYKRMLLMHRYLDVETASRKAGFKTVVSDEWKLVRLAGAADEVVASHVAALDIHASGVVRSNGFRIQDLEGRVLLESDVPITHFT